MKSPDTPAEVPRSFVQYLRSMGPGIVVALTWLGAGDMVDSAVAGGHYGYSLMWAMVIALFVRFAFVSIIAKYQLCNQHGESVMAGLRRLHPWLPWFVGLIGLVFVHFYGSYMVKGTGEASARLLGFMPAGAWSVFWVCMAAVFLYRGAYRHVEMVFYAFLVMLSVSLLGVAVWSGPDPVAAVKGALLFDLPEQTGQFSALLVILSLIGAVGGSISNLLYPYFMQQKGWHGPKFRRLQTYDLAFGTLILVVLNLSVWTIGAEVLNPRGITLKDIDDLANLLTIALGALGGPIFYLGVFAALYSSVIGSATGYGLLCVDVVSVSRPSNPLPARRGLVSQLSIYRLVVAWGLFSPLIWSLPGMPGFVFLTVVANAGTVIVLPVLSGSLWYITARKRYIGETWRNKAWENGLMGGLFVLSLWGAYQSAIAIWAAISG
ncbi:MAG: Nramp family divalent metal transporter [Betaproteobacteria bacterium]|nr:MAG: Nramp family divalent metal transporter [Betaproteobacteria bacterium]